MLDDNISIYGLTKAPGSPIDRFASKRIKYEIEITYIRIKLSDYLVQVSFKNSETIKDVYDFVQELLAVKNEYILFTDTPKRIYEYNMQTLEELNLSHNTLLMFESNINLAPTIKPELITNYCV